MKFCIRTFLFPTLTASAFVAFSPQPESNILPGLPFLNEIFKVVEHPNERGAVVLEAPVGQDGVNMYIAIDVDSYGPHIDRPGNGGIRLLKYLNSKDAIDDAVRLAKGMTRKHDMFRTGFAGAKVVVQSSHDDLSNIERQGLMRDAANALDALQGRMYTGCE